jgi:hypothetical protein
MGLSGVLANGGGLRPSTFPRGSCGRVLLLGWLPCGVACVRILACSCTSLAPLSAPQEHDKDLETRLAQSAAELELARQTTAALEQRLVRWQRREGREARPEQ